MVLEIRTGLFKTFATYFEKHLVGKGPAFCVCSQLSAACHVSWESSFVNFGVNAFFFFNSETNNVKEAVQACTDE